MDDLSGEEGRGAGNGASITEQVTHDTKRLASLKREIALQSYEVDSAAVAEAILLKLRLVRRGRMAIAAQRGDRTRGLDGSFRRAR
jgi:hypothetical protein